MENFNITFLELIGIIFIQFIGSIIGIFIGFGIFEIYKLMKNK